MVCMRIAFHENDGNHENDENDSDSHKQGAECWISENYGNDENHGNPGCKPRVPQTMPEMLFPAKKKTDTFLQNNELPAEKYDF